MKNRSDQGARGRAYVDTPKTGNAERGDFSCLPAWLGLTEATQGVGSPCKASKLAAVAALVPGPSRPNAIPLHSMNRP